MKNKISSLFSFAVLVFFVGFTTIAFSQKQNRPFKKEKLNVLFIMVDDLRPELNCYGKKEIISPNIDRLAADGVLFERTYCQQALCSPSRTSLLTGLRPDSTHVYDLQTHFRNTVPDVVTLPQHFKQNGYYTAGLGKVYHGSLNDPLSWSEAQKKLRNRKEIDEDQNQGKNSRPSTEMKDVNDDTYDDGVNTESAIELLRELSSNRKPFFIALGLKKPHLPFYAPKKYWDLYDPSSIKLPVYTSVPKNAPPQAYTNFGELRNYSDIPEQGPLSEELTRKLIHGYRACVSYMDAQAGRVITELKRLGLDKNTIVVLWGDHGFKLGEFGLWSKHTNFELDTRVPLIIRMPGIKAKGKKTNALVESLDIYPTICDLAGLPKPAHVQGTSLVPLLNNVNLPWREMAFSQFSRGQYMGYSIRTDRYRFTRWQQKNNPENVAAMELYDLQKDPDASVNIAGLPENKDVISKLQEMMQKADFGTKKVFAKN